MCVSKPKAPKVKPIPDRRASVLPDQGDPGIALARRKRSTMGRSAMIFTKQGILGAPSVAAPGTGPGY